MSPKRFCALNVETMFVLAAAAAVLAWGTPKRGQRLTISNAEANRMLSLMDKDQNGRISREEFVTFMENELRRMDANRDGELDVKELTSTDVRIASAVHRRFRQ